MPKNIFTTITLSSNDQIVVEKLNGRHLMKATIKCVNTPAYAFYIMAEACHIKKFRTNELSPLTIEKIEEMDAEDVQSIMEVVATQLTKLTL